MKNILNQIEKGSIKEYNRNIKLIVDHMKKEHGLYKINEKQNELMAYGLSFG